MSASEKSLEVGMFASQLQRSGLPPRAPNTRTWENGSVTQCKAWAPSGTSRPCQLHLRPCHSSFLYIHLGTLNHQAKQPVVGCNLLVRELEDESLPFISLQLPRKQSLVSTVVPTDLSPPSPRIQKAFDKGGWIIVHVVGGL